jgi:hypothetical protein
MSKVYRLIKVGSKPRGSGATQPRTVDLQGVGKWGVLSDTKYIVANEYICAKMGEFIGLPIPPFAIVQGQGSHPDPWFVSLDFNLTGKPLPDIDPVECVAHFPSLSVGVVMFDVWIANSDRHIGNINMDHPMSRAPRINVFDHSHALFGLAGPDRLKKLRDALGITESANTGANRHCLIDELQGEQFFDEWFNRIRLTPDFFIDDCCASVAELGILTPHEKELAADFLKHRRDSIQDIAMSDVKEFPGIRTPSFFWGARNQQP